MEVDGSGDNDATTPGAAGQPLPICGEESRVTARLTCGSLNNSRVLGLLASVSSLSSNFTRCNYTLQMVLKTLNLECCNPYKRHPN